MREREMMDTRRTKMGERERGWILGGQGMGERDDGY